MQENDKQFIERMKVTPVSLNQSMWSDVERMKRIARDDRARRFAEVLRPRDNKGAV